MSSLAVAHNKPANGSFASLLEKLTGVSNEDLNIATADEDLRFASTTANSPQNQRSSETIVAKRPRSRAQVAPAAQVSSSSYLRAAELSYENASRNASRNGAPPVATAIGTPARRPRQMKIAKLPADSSEQAVKNPANQPRMATETFPPIVPISFSLEKLRSSPTSSRQPKRAVRKTPARSSDRDVVDVEPLQDTSIVEAESEGITHLQLAALIAELGAEGSFNPNDHEQNIAPKTAQPKDATSALESFSANALNDGIFPGELGEQDLSSARGSSSGIAKDPLPAFRSTTISVNLSESEFSMTRQRAFSAGVSLSAYIRACVLAEGEPRAEINQALATMRQAALHTQAARFPESKHRKQRSEYDRTSWSQRIKQFFHAWIKPDPRPDSRHSPMWRTNLSTIRSF